MRGEKNIDGKLIKIISNNWKKVGKWEFVLLCWLPKDENWFQHSHFSWKVLKYEFVGLHPQQTFMWMIFLGWLLKIFYWIERSAVSHEILKGFLAIRVFRDIWEMKLQVNIRKFGFNWRQSNYKKRQPKKIFTKKKLSIHL